MRCPGLVLGMCLSLFGVFPTFSTTTPRVQSLWETSEFLQPNEAFYDIVNFDTNFLKHGKTGYSGLVFYLGFMKPLYINAEPLRSQVQEKDEDGTASILSKLVNIKCGLNIYSHPHHKVEQSNFRVTAVNGSSNGLWVVQFLKTEKLHTMGRHFPFYECTAASSAFNNFQFTDEHGALVDIQWDSSKLNFSRKSLHSLPKTLFYAPSRSNNSSKLQGSMLHYKKKHLDKIARYWIESMSDEDIMKVLSLYRAIANARVDWGKFNGTVNKENKNNEGSKQTKHRRRVLQLNEDKTGQTPVKVSKAEADFLGMLQLEHKLQAAENAGTGVAMKTIREELEKPLINTLQYDVPEIMMKLLNKPTTEAIASIMQSTQLRAISEAVLDLIDTNWRNAVNQPGVNAHKPAGSQDHHKVGLADDVAWGITEAVSEELLGSIVEKVEKKLVVDIPNIVTRNVVREMYPTMTRSLTEDLSQGIAHELEEPLTREAVQDIAQALIPALTLSLAPIITHSLTRRPSHDYYCFFCEEKQLYCEYCQKASADSAQTDYYAAYYASYFSRYYAYYYGRMELSNFDDQKVTPAQKPLMQSPKN